MTRVTKLLIYIAIATSAVIALVGTTMFLFNIPVMAVCLALSIILGGFWIINRVWKGKAVLPKTGLEIPLILFFTGLTIAMVFSRTPRIGFERLAWFVTAAMLFYILVDLFKHPVYQTAIRYVMIVVTLPIIFHALSETYVQYLTWWEQSGDLGSSPPFQIRFISLLNHSNIFMEVMNMIAPLAVVIFFTTQKRSIRLLCAFWLVSFFASIPFSSSRGGWLGAVGWMGVLFIWWMIDQSRWKFILNFFRRHLIPSIALAAALAVVLIFGGLKFYNMFAGSNPTHGAAASLNREHLWDSAVQVWEQSPWIGSGLGRFGLATFEVMRGYPTGNAPAHAHSTPLQLLGETGLVGFIPFLILTGSALLLFAKAYRGTTRTERMWIAASLAAFASAFLHGIFEDYTYRPVVMFILVAHAALILSTAKPLRHVQNLSLGWFVVPGTALLILGMFNLWSRTPLDNALQDIDTIDWRTAAQAAGESQRRDPKMPYFGGQAGVAYAMAWQQTGDSNYLHLAQQSLLKAADVESGSSMLWANMAILYWYDHHPQQALDAIQRAIALCPQEPGFYLNYAWMIENIGQHEQAQTLYQKALEIAPHMANHPFWSSSADRSLAVAPFAPGNNSSGSHWESALAHLSAGDVTQARYELAVSNLFEESKTSRASAWATFAFTEHSAEDELPAYESLIDAIQYDYWGTNIGGGVYSLYFLRSGFPMSVVPGYIRITPDTGQLDHLHALVERQIASSRCEDAAHTWQILQREIQAGALPEGGYPALPACPSLQ